MSRNNNLYNSSRNKHDEFYTNLQFVKDELKHCSAHFGGKRVLCNCGKDLSGTIGGAGGVGGLLYITVDGTVYVPTYDNNGNVTRYCDAHGNAVASYAYDAFGNTVAQAGPMADSFPHRFSTKYLDSETGLYYYGYRYYSPTLMRWLNRDPIEEDGGVNLYAMCGNNGLAAIDTLGQKCSISESPIRIYKDRIRTNDGSTPRAFTDIKTSVKTHCSRRRLRVKGEFSRHIYMLKADSERWNQHYRRYDSKWGAPRDNAKEMDATYAHEYDHYRSYDVYSNYVKALNEMDGRLLRGCCKKESDKINSTLKSVFGNLSSFSKGFDIAPNNQGGMYDQRRNNHQGETNDK